jgi:DNA-binding response OmpR family regulator
MNRLKILIIDDEPKIAETVRTYMEAGGYDAETAQTGAEALSLNRSYHPDLIILDLMLPDISGEQVCEIIRRDSSVPIIMLSAKSREDSVINGLKIGADDYIIAKFKNSSKD